jgi:carbonic anhydrase/acetyltransferase-like protein (isoleucine patch superfamily)
LKPPHIPRPVIHPTALLAPGSYVCGQVEIGADVFVLFGAVVRAEFDRISVGAQTNIQDNAVLHCDEDIPCHLGRRITVGHSAVVHGAEVGDGALIGIGARVLNRAVVGEGAWLAAGSVLAEGKTISPWTLAVGIPARPVRELTEDEVRRADEGVQHYLDLAKVYREIFSNSC